MSTDLFFPPDYKTLLTPQQTEKAILTLKSFFQQNLAFELDLVRVTAPLFVKAGTGINDDLNGVERPVAFDINCMEDVKAEIVQSLAKWKRMMLKDLDIELGTGIYTDMNAIRPDDLMDNLHSIYVDQWDWEVAIYPDNRSLAEKVQLQTQATEPFYDLIIGGGGPAGLNF